MPERFIFLHVGRYAKSKTDRIFVDGYGVDALLKDGYTNVDTLPHGHYDIAVTNRTADAEIIIRLDGNPTPPPGMVMLYRDNGLYVFTHGQRPDEPEKIMAHAGRYSGGRALVILGGNSGKRWRAVAEKIKPDVIIGVNGVNSVVPNLDYWLCMENMIYPARMADTEKRYADIMAMYRRTGPKVRIVNHQGADLIPDQSGLIRAERVGYEYNEIGDIDWRGYSGYVNGARMQRSEIAKDLRVGTVALQAVHHAAILGVRHIHTIGFDMCYHGHKHHWYKYPAYAASRYYGDNMFTRYRGLDTSWFWLDTADYLAALEPGLRAAGVLWRDHSGGLLKLKGVAQ